MKYKNLPQVEPVEYSGGGYNPVGPLTAKNNTTDRFVKFRVAARARVYPWRAACRFFCCPANWLSERWSKISQFSACPPRGWALWRDI